MLHVAQGYQAPEMRNFLVRHHWNSRKSDQRLTINCAFPSSYLTLFRLSGAACEGKKSVSQEHVPVSTNLLYPHLDYPDFSVFCSVKR